MNSLKISEIKKETKDSCVLRFEIPQNLKSEFTYLPGQFLTLSFDIDGKKVNRCYSLSSSPYENVLEVGVKRVEGGLVSNYINDTLKVGDYVNVLKPAGDFCIQIEEKSNVNYYLFAAGSGITPMLSILKSILEKEKGNVYLLYGNSTHDSIMFFDEIEYYQNKFKERLHVVHTLSQESRDSFWSGRIEPKSIKNFLNEKELANSKFFICGPGKMIENTNKALLDLGVVNDSIFFESFGSTISSEKYLNLDKATVDFSIDGACDSVTLNSNQTLLRAIMDKGYNPKFSCEAGVCKVCICTLEEGEVEMLNNGCLSDEEVKARKILSCQSVAKTPILKVTF
ncbi:MAG: ferredoxin--NADP reductase [Bacteriovoracaceae bacterium]|jgi:ring-1,2-phenylacetyl-CoA epoxidase subunit PaaE|nr:ferredoxin--NADP reductase [Bacteriovoracaceae bacterium]